MCACAAAADDGIFAAAPAAAAVLAGASFAAAFAAAALAAGAFFFLLQDNGVGMSRDELVKNLGTIARSGSLEFLKNAGPNASKDIIGQVRSKRFTRIV